MSKSFRGRSGIILASVVVALAAAGTAFAQTFPNKPVEFVVHVTPGGGTDVFARAVTEVITRDKLLPQPVIVGNRPGGSGAIAFTYIKSKRGDPHVILTVATGSLMSAVIRSDLALGLDILTPLAFFALDPQMVAVAAGSKITSFRDLLEAGRREPDTAIDAVASAGGTGRLLLYYIERETGVKFKFVAFKSGAEAALSVLGGHVPFTTENLSEMYSQVEAKKMRVLAVTGEKRLPILPDVPTLKELGYPIVFGTGRGFAMPAGVPKEAAAVMEAALKKVYESPGYREFASRNMYEDLYMGSAEFSQYLAKRRDEMVGFMAQMAPGQK
jgi:putative tricarboxylic transport membrane protein